MFVKLHVWKMSHLQAFLSGKRFFAGRNFDLDSFVGINMDKKLI